MMVLSGSASYTGPNIHASGAPRTRFSPPLGSTFPSSLPKGSSVTLLTPSGFSYQFVTKARYLTTSVGPATGSNSFTNSVIGFFAQNSLLWITARHWKDGEPACKYNGQLGDSPKTASLLPTDHLQRLVAAIYIANGSPFEKFRSKFSPLINNSALKTVN